MKPELRQQMFERLRARNPQPTTELEYSTPFELLVAVILSAQATDKGVNVATRKLFPVANTPAAILALGEAGLVDYVKTIGLYRGKARNIIATCKLLLEQHDGAVPHDRDALEALPGVGRKTANVVLNTAFGELAETNDGLRRELVLADHRHDNHEADMDDVWAERNQFMAEAQELRTNLDAIAQDFAAARAFIVNQLHLFTESAIVTVALLEQERRGMRS